MIFLKKRKMNLIFLKDKVLIYIDEQICSRLNGKLKKNCKEMLDTNGRDLINNIQNGIVRRKKNKESKFLVFIYLII